MRKRLRDFFRIAEWVIRYVEGEPPLIKGTPPRGFLRECHSLLKEAGLRKAGISGVNKHGLIILEFDASVPQNLHQRLRNLWSTNQDR